MRLVSFVNKTRGTTLAAQTRVAESFIARARGLLYGRQIQAGEGLFLKPCNSIHMIGMTYAIDAVFVDEALKVIALVESIKPMQVSQLYSKATGCLELPVGTISGTGTQMGDELAMS